MAEIYSPSNSPAMSDDVRMLTGALLKSKQEFIATGLNGKNSHQNYNYAKLGDIYSAVEKGLNTNEIIIVHLARKIDSVEHLFTRLIHSPSNQWIEDVRQLDSEKPGNQAKGAANTYMKKAAVLALCAIAAEDDDGEDEEKHIEKNSISQESNTHKEPKKDFSQYPVKEWHLKELNKVLSEYDQEDAKELVNVYLKRYQISSLDQLKQFQHAEIIEELK